MAGQYVLLSIKRQVLGELVHQDIRQESRPSQAPLDRIGRRPGRRHAVLASRAGVLGVDVPPHNHSAGHVVELLGYVFADPHLLAATAAQPTFGRDVMGNILARHIVGDDPAAMPLATLARRGFIGRLGLG